MNMFYISLHSYGNMSQIEKFAIIYDFEQGIGGLV